MRSSRWDTRDVGIDDDANILAEGVSKHYVGRLSSNAGQGGQLIHRLRDLAAMLFDQTT